MFWIVFMTLQRTPTPIGRNVKCYYTEHLIKVKKKNLQVYYGAQMLLVT